MAENIRPEFDFKAQLESDFFVFEIFPGVGLPHGGFWRELLNSDSEIYGGSGIGNAGGVQAEMAPAQGRIFSFSLTLPPLGILFFKC